MVDGIGKNATPHTTIKLKGKDGQTINLNSLNGLQQTKQNEALFKMYDKNKDGKIDEKEAVAMRNNLQSLAGNGTISNREINKLFGKGSNALDALSNLADQQAAFEKGLEYTETNGNTKTHIYNSSTENGSYRYDETKFENGAVKYTMDDGSTEIRTPDGKRLVTSKDGVETLYDKNGHKTLMKHPDGSVDYFTTDGNTRVTKNADGQTTSKQELVNGQEVTTNYEYSDGKTIARSYNGSNNSAPLSSVTVSEKKDGHNIDTKYATEEDMKNGRPSEQITDAHNPTTKTVTKFTYDDKGNVKAETTNSAGETTTKYTNAQGEEIQDTQFGNKNSEFQSTYTVPKGHGLNRIASDLLKQQGIENPTAEQIKDARNQIVEANKDQVHTMKDGKYKGSRYFYADAQIKVPQFNQTQRPEQEEDIDGGTLSEVAVTAGRISPELKAKKQELQAQLGNDYDVGYSRDGKSLEVRDKDGNVLAEATKQANDSSTNEDDINTMMQSDTDNSKTLDKTEYQAFVTNMLNDVGFEINDSNKAKVMELINNSFTSMDTIQQDTVLSKEELTQNAQKVIEQLTDELGSV